MQLSAPGVKVGAKKWENAILDIFTGFMSLSNVHIAHTFIRGPVLWSLAC